MPWGQRFDLLIFKAKIKQGNTFTGRRKQWPLVNVTHGFDPKGISSNDHFTFGSQDCETIRTIKSSRRFSQHIDPIDSGLRLAQQTTELMKDNLSIRIKSQVVIPIG